MTQWNIFQLVSWLDRYVQPIYTEMFLEIKILNETNITGKFWSKWIDKE